MVPCHICGKDSAQGWIIGFPPAPDSQKMGLCLAHDSQEERKAVIVEWQKMLQQRIRGYESKNTSLFFGSLRFLTVEFVTGARVSFYCKEFASEQGALKIIEEDGTATFIPFGQIKTYTVKNVDETD